MSVISLEHHIIISKDSFSVFCPHPTTKFMRIPYIFAKSLIRLYQMVSTSCPEGIKVICEVLKQVFWGTLPLDTTFVLCSVYIPECAGSCNITLADRADLWLPALVE